MTSAILESRNTAADTSTYGYHTGQRRHVEDSINKINTSICLCNNIEDCSRKYNNTSCLCSCSIDVTDNKTNELLCIPTGPIHSMDDKFHREDERRKTFANWPLDLDRNELARYGMFYTGDADKVKCYFCEVEIGRWEHDDQPLSEHLRFSPNCPLLRRRTTNNVPLDVDALANQLPAISYDVCGTDEPPHVEIRPNAYAEGTIPTRSMSTTTVNNAGSNCATLATATTAMSYYPEYPEYAIEAARIRSFAEWPCHMKQKPHELAEAGFFYTGVGDRVKCFSCGGGLKDWAEDDDPWEQHALWMKMCRYLKLMKGPVYIDAVTAAKDKAKDTTNDVIVSVLTTASNTATTVTQTVPNTMQQSDETSKSSVAAISAAPDCNNIMQDDKCRNINNDENNTTLATVGTEMASTNEKRTSSAIPEEKLCKICYAAEYNTAFLPCGHVVACAKCASSVVKCPLCRKPFTDMMRVYFS